MKAPKDLVAEILPDEVPYAKAVALEALAASPPRPGRGCSDVAVRELVDRVAARVGVDQRLAQRGRAGRIELGQPGRIVQGRDGADADHAGHRPGVPVDDPFDPEKNLEAGMRHLRSLLEHYGTTACALWPPTTPGRAPSAGTAGCRRIGKRSDYVQRVLALVRQR